MQGWKLTGVLIGLALVAVRWTPTWSVGPIVGPIVGPTTTPALQAHAESAGLSLRLDHTSLLRGSTGEHFLTVTLRSPEAAVPRPLRPLDLAIVLDRSGSMAEADKLRRAVDAARQLITGLAHGDRFSLVVFDDVARAVIAPSLAPADAEVLAALDRLSPGGGTNLHGGLLSAVDLVRGNARQGELDRVVLLSDGEANVGITATAGFLQLAREAQAAGVTLSTVGLGLDYEEDLLATIADEGGGHYTFVEQGGGLGPAFADELERASKVLGRRGELILDLPAHVELIEVVGWTPTRTGPHGAVVPLGDLYAGGSRQVVARVRITSEAQTDLLPIAAATATWYDVATEASGSSRATLDVALTDDPYAARQSAEADVRIAATRAWAGGRLDASTRLYASGDTWRAIRLIEEARTALRDLGPLPSESVQADLRALDDQRSVYQSFPPRTPDGARAVKAGKQRYLDVAR